MSKKAVIITTDGRRTLVEFNNQTSYKTLSDAVGGLIECVHLPKTLNLDLWVNDNGKNEGLELNAYATSLWITNYGVTDVIVGDVAFTSRADRHGNTLGLNDEQVSYLMDTNLVDLIEPFLKARRDLNKQRDELTKE